MVKVITVTVEVTVTIEDLSLEELFAHADAIGTKYQSEAEIDEFAAKMQGIRDSARDFGLLDDLD
jgi:hypothetical protein